MQEFVFSHWHWLILTLILLVVEVLTATAFFLWLSAASTAVAVVVYFFPTMIWQYQLAWAAVFIVLSIVLWRLWGKWFAANTPQDNPALNRRSEQYIGRTFQLSEPIINGIGKITVDDSTWRVRCDQDAPLNTRVRVVAAKGMILEVELLEKNSAADSEP